MKQKKDRSVPTIYIGNAERSFSDSANTLPASRRAADFTGSLERLEGLAQTLVLNRQHVAKLGSRKRFPRNQAGEHSLLEIALAVVLRLGDNFQMGRCRVGGHKLQRHGG